MIRRAGKFTRGMVGMALAAALLPAASAHAQAAIDCGPVGTSFSRGLEPVMQGRFADEDLHTILVRGYHQFYVERNFSDARTTLTAADEAAIAKHNVCAEGLAALALGAVAERIAMKDAAGWYRKAKTAFTAADSKLGVGRVMFGEASVDSSSGNNEAERMEYAAAAKALEEAGDPYGALSASLGSLPFGKDDTPQLQALSARARALHSPCLEAQVLWEWGDHDHDLAQMQSAFEHYEAAEKAFQSCPNSAEMRAYLQTSMGRLERQHGRPEAALPHYRVALDLQRRYEPTYIPQTYNAMAVAYEAMGNVPEAIVYYKLGLEEAKKQHSQPFIDFLSANLGATYAHSGRPEMGIPLLEGASKNLKGAILCQRTTQLAYAYLIAGRWQEALAKDNISVAACEQSGSLMDRANVLADRANAHMELGQLDAAYADIHTSLDLLEQYRAHLVQQDAYKQGYISEKLPRTTYDIALELLMRMHRYGEAMEIAEQARARALLDLLTSAQRRGIASANETAAKAASVSLPSPEHASALTTEQMLAQAKRLQSTIVAYWAGEKVLYIWVAKPDGTIEGVRQPISSKQLDRMVRATLPGGSAKPAANPDAPWRALYDILIAPVDASLPKDKDALLTIVPSGALFRLSFAALADHHSRYLVERYRVHMIPSMGLLPFTDANAKAAAARSHYLLVADPAMLPLAQNGERLPRLPGTAAELSAILRIVPRADVTVLRGEQADRAHVEEASASARVVHFATHAVVDEDDPEKTFLALDAHSGSGKLTLNDIYALHLRANLVVLSACRTAGGRVTGDGVTGLSRAFFYAGAASVLATMWDVADAPTARFLALYYRSLQQAASPSEALRAAQLKMLADLRAGRVHAETLQGETRLPATPAVWASFSVIGEP